MISVPCFVVSVIFVILILVLGLSGVSSGRAGPVDADAVDRCCFGKLPSGMSSGTVRLGEGNGCRV